MTEETPAPEQIWLQVAAGLKNPGMRLALGQVLVGQSAELATDKHTRKNLERWKDIGLLHESEKLWVLNEQLLGDTLSAAAAKKDDQSGVLRYFTNSRLHTLPAKPAQRHAVLQYVCTQVLSPGEVIPEAEINERLRLIHPDVALLRRYFVDHGMVVRAPDGSGYRLPAR